MSNEMIFITIMAVYVLSVINFYLSGKNSGYMKGYNQAMKEYNERYNK